MLEAKALGQLLLMQSITHNLPNNSTIFSFICRGLKDIPGVEQVLYHEEKIIERSNENEYFSIQREGRFYGELELIIHDKDIFIPYREYLKNFFFTIGVVLEERHRFEINKRQNLILEKEVTKHTKKLREEIEERKKITVALRASEELFRTSFQNTPAGVCLVKPDGYFLATNKCFCNMFGYTANELLQLTFNDITHPDDKNKSNEVVSKLLSGEINQINFEKRYLHKTGRTVLASVSTNLFQKENSDNKHFITFVTDITESRSMQQAIIRSERKYKSLFENMTTGFALHQLIYNDKGQAVDYRFLEVNPAFEKHTNQKAEQLIGKTILDIAPETATLWIQRFGEVGRDNKTIAYHSYEKEIDKHFECWAFCPEKDHFAVIFTDVSQRTLALKELENNKLILQEQNEAYEAMNEELIQINDELEQAKEKAEESDNLKTEFINNMSHEIRTPMNGIMGFANLLKETNVSAEKRSYYVNIINSSGKQLMRVIDDILEISKLGTKQVKTVQTEICLNDFFLNLFSVFDLKAKENKTPLYLKRGLSDSESNILTDETKLHKILSNLLENALKFTRNGYIEFGYILNNNKLEIYVKDTGIGISADKQKMIFERFSQEERELSKNVGGLGLGLSIAKENAELLGGTIDLISEKGQGACFVLKIPYSKANNASKDQPTSPKEKSYTVLIAEDEEVNYLYIEALVESIDLNIEIIHSRNGLEALNICKDNPNIDLILMDLKMSVMNGYEATTQIKELRPNLKIIAQTAYTTQNDQDKARAAGCDDFLSKPIKRELFNEVIKKYLPV